MNREWEKWETTGVAEALEEYWRTSELERAHRDELSTLVARRLPASDTTVLEVGCGTGEIYGYLVDKAPPSMRYVGVDTAPSMLNIARRKFPNGMFLRGDGYQLQFPPASFDLVLCFEVLGHIPEADKFVGELLRVTKRTCIFTVWPTSDESIVEGQEIVNGAVFLRRQYSDAYIRSTIDKNGANRSPHTRSETLAGGGRAYIVQMP